MQLGKSIKELRIRAGLSQNELATKAKLTQGHLSNIERGVQVPGKKAIIKICKALRLPPPLIYIMAIEKSDIKYGKRGLYEKLKKPLNTLVELALTQIYG